MVIVVVIKLPELVYSAFFGVGQLETSLYLFTIYERKLLLLEVDVCYYLRNLLVEKNHLQVCDDALAVIISVKVGQLPRAVLRGD